MSLGSILDWLGNDLNVHSSGQITHPIVHEGRGGSLQAVGYGQAPGLGYMTETVHPLT